MASENRTQTTDLESALLERGDQYAFYQAYRLLRLINKQAGKDEESIRIRPNLGQAFQQTDIDQIEPFRERGYRMTVNFLGLYGVSSPLPNFYTDDLLAEWREGNHGQRDFIDIFNQVLYPMVFRAWLKSRIQMRLVEFGDVKLWQVLHAFVGLLNLPHDLRQPGGSDLFRFAGIFFQQPRSTLGLWTILSGCYPSAKVDILQQQLELIPIPQDQCLRLGMRNHQLGEETHIGAVIPSRSVNAVIELSELDAETFHDLQPGGYQYERVKFIVRYYLLAPLNINLRLKLRASDVKAGRLSSGNWSRLGCDVWLAPSTDHSTHGVLISI